ncbi:MAG: sn-glycerol-3-phosphate ABC transporter ATP-binding protein UgpC [Ruminococcaceae bacterium]|nr:sn-glycerol-3-phosphate ABC transporter ATP-binding protein UgpC [Oscillospiraceae bacterium]
MASLSLRHIYKKYPGGVTAVSDFNLEVKDKEFLVLVGPSGCGKTTTLRMIAGLEEITEGELFIGDRLVNDVAPKDREIAMVFQNYALYPHMSVFENMAFGLKLNKVPKEKIKRLVEEAARVLDITHLLDRKPKALSGGQKQRVALGRAIVREPKVFLLDEPLSNLDAKLRAAMRTELTKLHKRVGTTFVYVTHDQVEAMTMATRIVVMKDGLIQQVDTPQKLYDYPCNIFVAGFLGTPQMNFINGKLVKGEDGVYFEFQNVSLKLPEEKANAEELQDYIDKEVVIGLRPEAISDSAEAVEANPEYSFEVNVDVTELMGAEIYLYLTVGDPENEPTSLIARVSSRSQSRAGDKISVSVDMSRFHIFDKDTEVCVLH